MKTKPKINKWNLIKGCFTAKEIINKMKKQPTEQDKIFANDKIDEKQFPEYKLIIHNYIIQLTHLNIKKKKPNQKMGR